MKSGSSAKLPHHSLPHEIPPDLILKIRAYTEKCAKRHLSKLIGKIETSATLGDEAFYELVDEVKENIDEITKKEPIAKQALVGRISNALLF